MLAKQGTYPAVPDTTSTGRGNPDCELPCPVEDLFNVDAVIVTHLHFDHFDDAAAELLPKQLTVFLKTKKRQKFSRDTVLRTYDRYTKKATIFTALRSIEPIVITDQAVW